MVAHHIGYILDSHLLGRFDPQRHTVLGVMSHGVIHVCVGILRDHIAVAVIECEPSVAENVECAPDSGLASSQRAEIGRAIRVTEAELAVRSAIPALLSGKIDDIRSIDAVFRVIEGESRDAGLVRMAADIAVRNAHSHPHGAFLGCSLADHFHYPRLVLVRDGE